MSTILDTHAQCIDLLSGLVAGTLPANVASGVVAHVSECSTCSAELETARRLNAHFARRWSTAPSPMDPMLDPHTEQAGFDALWARITAESKPVQATTRRLEWPARFAALAATLLLGGGLAWYFTAGDQQYRTLADPSHTCVALRVHFAASTPAAEALRMIEASGATVLSSSQDVYTVSAHDPAESARQLRMLHGVTAEPTGC